MQDSNAEDRLLLGTVGWEKTQWLTGYYPADLPPEWRLAYYANDCGCVMLPASVWCDEGGCDIDQALDEAPRGLQLFLQMPMRAGPGVRERLRRFASLRVVLLVDRAVPDLGEFPQWVAQGSGGWVDSDTGAQLVLWVLDAIDWRDLRARADALPGGVRALVVDGPAADPGAISDLRTLLELMGRG